MLVVGISGSPRRDGNTAKLVKHVLAVLEESGAKTKYASLADKQIKPCVACEACMRDGVCPVKDDFGGLLETVVGADGVVLASPNYAFGMSAQMKALFDRSHSLLYYMRRLEGKYGIGIAVGGHPFRTHGLAKWLAQGTWLCGGNTVGAISGVSRDRDLHELFGEASVLEKAGKVARKLALAIKDRRRYRWQDFMRSFFIDRNLRKMVSTKKGKYPFLYNYYEQRKWL